VVFLVAAIVGLVFGGADQYLGSLVLLGSWTSTVSGVSAPWLVLAFACGTTQTQQHRAALVGLTAVMSALAGYFLMTISPIESVPLNHFPADMIALARADLAVIIGGLALAPLFGLLGQRWRTKRSWISAAAAAATICLEPLARFCVGRLWSPELVWLIEISLGTCLAAYFVQTGRTYRRRLRAST
jgi:hypothetical protein